MSGSWEKSSALAVARAQEGEKAKMLLHLREEVLAQLSEAQSYGIQQSRHCKKAARKKDEEAPRFAAQPHKRPRHGTACFRPGKKNKREPDLINGKRGITRIAAGTFVVARLRSISARCKRLFPLSRGLFKEGRIVTFVLVPALGLCCCLIRKSVKKIKRRIFSFCVGEFNGY
jgi:hypothetical protein